MNNKNSIEQSEVIKSLCEKWEQNNSFKNDFAFGLETIDKDGIVELIRETFLAIKDFKIRLLGCEDIDSIEGSISSSNAIPAERNITPNYIIAYSNLITELGIFSAEAEVYIDESENYIFPVSQAIIRNMLEYANYCLGFIPTNKDNVLYGTCDSWGIYRPINDDDDEFWDKSFKYDTNTGDMSEIFELVKRADEHI